MATSFPRIESFLCLQKHIAYNHIKQKSKEEAKTYRPDYCKNKYKIHYDNSNNWHTPKDLLEIYSFLKNDKKFTTEFIGELAYTGLIIGKYSPSESCYHISLPSFVDLLKYRDYTVKQYLFLTPLDL